MRKALPWVLLVLAIAIGLAVWKTEGFGLLGDSADKNAVPVEGSPDAADAEEGGLKGRGTAPEKDPKTYEGDPVGVVDAGRGSAAVAGRVIDATSGGPIRFARVSLVPATADEGRVAVRTTMEGRFEVRGLPAGPLDLR